MAQLSKRKLNHTHPQWIAQNGQCFYCEANLFPSNARRLDGGPHPRAATRDHIVPKCRGGTARPRNIVIACVQCNLAKAAADVGDFIQSKHCDECNRTFRTPLDAFHHRRDAHGARKQEPFALLLGSISQSSMEPA